MEECPYRPGSARSALWHSADPLTTDEVRRATGRGVGVVLAELLTDRGIVWDWMRTEPPRCMLWALAEDADLLARAVA